MAENNNAKTTTRDINAAQRASLALQMRAAKTSYAKIAEQCGYADRGAAHHAIQREMQRVVVANVDELRQEESVTLDLLQSECMKLFLDRNNKIRLFAADRILAIMERRAKLMGLDAKPGEELIAQVVVREVPAGYLEAPKE